jgi:hypothetical protein
MKCRPAILALFLSIGCAAPKESDQPSEGPECPNGDPLVGYPDEDGDGFGVPQGRLTACDALPDGYASNSTDCDDTDDEVHPDAEELCDGVDNDCDFETDEGAVDKRTFYLDADNDGFGDDEDTISACDLPDGYVLWGGDCSPIEPDIHPNAEDICDEIDNDCSGVIDDGDGEDMLPWYPDTDGDGHGDVDVDAVIYACDAPEGTTGSPSDCDDTDAAVHLGATELCDGIDNDCDGTVDEADDCTDE